jgi:hypothetical protein
MVANQHVKVAFDLDPANKQGYETETVWAEPLGGDQFRLLNSPFFVFGVSAEDLVSAIKIQEGVYKFQRVLHKAGHSTYRIFLQSGTINEEAFQGRWGAIQTLGASFESGNGRFVSVDVPPGADGLKIRTLLKQGEEEGVWVFEEANFEGAAGRVQ